MDKVYIFGHKNPDTDSVCASIALSYLKNKLGINAEPRILSPTVNKETEYVLKRFNIPVPKYLNDVKVQLKDVKYKKYYINENDSIFSTYNYITDKGISGIPLIDDKKHFVGYVSLKEIASELVMNDSNTLNTTFNAIK